MNKKLSIEEVMAINGEKIIKSIKESLKKIYKKTIVLDISFQGYIKGTIINVITSNSIDNCTAFERYEINENDLILTGELKNFDDDLIMKLGNYRVMRARKLSSGSLYASPFIDEIKNDNIPEPASNQHIIVVGKIIEVIPPLNLT